MSGPRIILVGDQAALQATRAVRAYAERFELPWVITAVDQIDWRSEAVQRELEASQPAGIIGWIRPPWPSWIRARGIPLVAWTWGAPGDGWASLLAPDDDAVGRCAARHFQACGIRHVAVVRHWGVAVRSARFRAFLAEAQRLGLATHVHRPDAVEAPAALAEERCAAWLRLAPHPLGVFLHQDRDALQFMLFCRRFGISVPQEVAVLGVDDIPACAASDPPVSSVAWPVAAIATRMAAILHRRLNGSDAPAAAEPVAPFRTSARESTRIASGDAAVDRLRARIVAEPGRPWPGARLARLAGLSPAQLHRRFRDAYGCTPGEAVRRERLRLAQELLASGDQRVAVIARRCGFGSSEAIAKAFRLAGPPPPSAWRQA